MSIASNTPKFTVKTLYIWIETEQSFYNKTIGMVVICSVNPDKEDENTVENNLFKINIPSHISPEGQMNIICNVLRAGGANIIEL